MKGEWWRLESTHVFCSRREWRGSHADQGHLRPLCEAGRNSRLPTQQALEFTAASLLNSFTQPCRTALNIAFVEYRWHRACMLFSCARCDLVISAPAALC